jgi:hypothetical protein
MLGIGDKERWLVVGSGAAAIAGFGARKALEVGWKAITGKPAPENPEMRHVKWRDAILWAAASGLVIGVARLVGQRLAAQGWTSVLGEDPPRKKLV